MEKLKFILFKCIGFIKKIRLIILSIFLGSILSITIALRIIRSFNISPYREILFCLIIWWVLIVIVYGMIHLLLPIFTKKVHWLSKWVVFILLSIFGMWLGIKLEPMANVTSLQLLTMKNSLEIESTGYYFKPSLANQVKLIGVSVNGRIISYNDFTINGAWALKNGRLISQLGEYASLLIDKPLPFNAKILIDFMVNDSSGVVIIRSNGEEKLINLYALEENKKTVELRTMVPKWFRYIVRIADGVSLGIILYIFVSCIIFLMIREQANLAKIKLMILSWFRKISIRFKPVNSSIVFIISVLLTCISFLILRLAWMLDYPFVKIYRDSIQYLLPVKQMQLGELPNFSFISSGYPLFLSLSLSISQSLKFTIVFQNLILLSSVIFLLWTIYRFYKANVLIISIALIGGITAQPVLNYYSYSPLTETLYASFIIFFIAWMIQAINTGRYLHYFLISLSASLLVCIHQRGLVILLPLVLLAIHLYLNHLNKRILFILFIPFILSLTLQTIYNYYSNRTVAYTVMADDLLGGLTFYFWEPDITYPEKINNNVLLIRKNLPEKDIDVVQSSLNPNDLYKAYTNLFVFNQRSTINVYNFDQQNNLGLTCSEGVAWGRRLSRDAILKHPDKYLKYILTQVFIWFSPDESSVWNNAEYADQLILYINQLYLPNGNLNGQVVISSVSRATKDVCGNPYSEKLNPGKDFTYPYFEYQKRIYVPIFVLSQLGKVTLQPTMLYNFQKIFVQILSYIFKSIIWIYLYFIAFILSIWISIKSKLRNNEAFILLVCSSLFLFSGIEVSLISRALDRYKAPVYFLIYFCVIFLFIMIKNWISSSRSKSMS